MKHLHKKIQLHNTFLSKKLFSLVNILLFHILQNNL